MTTPHLADLFQNRKDPYDHGLKLWDALFELGSERNINDYWKAEELLNAYLCETGPYRWYLYARSFFSYKTVDEAAGSISYFYPRRAKSASLHNLQREITNDLTHSLCYAFGYTSERHPDSQRQLIKADVWDGGLIDWERSTVRNGSIYFEGIRVFKSLQEAAEAPSAPTRNDLTKADDGQEEIPFGVGKETALRLHKIINDLISKGEMHAGLKRKDQVRLVQRELNKLVKAKLLDKAVSQEPIRRVLELKLPNKK